MKIKKKQKKLLKLVYWVGVGFFNILLIFWWMSDPRLCNGELLSFSEKILMVIPLLMIPAFVVVLLWIVFKCIIGDWEVSYRSYYL